MGSVYLDDPAATEMYTYCHTLPLRDALPFSTPGSMQKLMPTRLARIASSESVSVSTANSSAARRRSIQASSCACPVTISYAPGADRSEEHTSELQSIMRSSYAVFCLKKKQTTIHNCK